MRVIKTNKYMKSVNPYTNKELKSYPTVTKEDIDKVLAKSDKAYSTWKQTSFKERAGLMNKLAKLLRSKKDDLAKIATEEMGKPIKQAVAEVEKCAWVCEYYADNASDFLADKQLETDYHQSMISYEPIGAVLAVMPWNYPFWQVFRFAAPTLMAGNVAILKHASNVPACALAIEKLFLEAGFPKAVFQSLLISSKEVEQLIKADIVQAVSLTGSGKAGSIVSSQAAKEIKKSLLELGGNDAFIVLADADIDLAVEKAMLGRFQNNGQSCIAAKRFFIEEAIYDQFINEFKTKVEALTLGDPMDEKTDIGPLAKPEFVEELAKQVDESVKKGATILAGGEIEGEHKHFYQPTILENVKAGMPAFDEELFGPVASVTKVKSVEEAIELANNSKFGLGGCIFSKDIKAAQQHARKIVTGTVAINDITKSDPRAPFGGVKQSGFGRELGKNGILEFVNEKTIHIAKA